MFRTFLGSKHATAARKALALAIAILFAVALMPVAVPAQQGARVIQRNLAELVSTAETILHGRVLSVRTEPHPQFRGLMTVVVDVEIVELLKGQSGAPFSFRQYVWDNSDIRAKLQYKSGEEVLLLMIKPHPQTGLSSPAGQEQGRFRIKLDEQGNRLATNGFDNGALFRGMEPSTGSKLQSLNVQTRTMMTQHRGGPIPYDQLKSVILALAGN